MKIEQLRAQVLSEWRGLPQRPVMRDRTVAVNDALQKIMQSLGLRERLRSEEVVKAWEEIAGEFFARHSSPQRLKDGVLYVHVLQPTIHFELDRVWKREILEKLKKRFGARTVREIKFRLG
jgi:predicted nucleic acid-binding Zn ribbon protein